MSNDEKTKNNVLKLVKNQPGKPKSPKKEPVADTKCFITDERFKRAMDLMNRDMNRAFGLGQNAAASFQLLLGYLVEAGVVDPEKFNEYVKRNLREEENNNPI